MGNIGEEVNSHSRKAVLERIRESLGGRPQPVPLPPGVDESLIRTCTGNDNLTAMFRERAKIAGAKVTVASGQNYPNVLDKILQDTGCITAALWINDEFLEGSLRMAVEKVCKTVIRKSEYNYKDDSSEDVDVIITDVDGAIAETGTIVMSSTGNRDRLAHLTAPLHIAIVRKEQIVPDLIDFWNNEKTGEMIREASSIQLITGPSKTADIEGVLVTGVHGPAQLHIIILRG